ncbi:MFS transporter, partial [Tsukamurella paurometabola]
FGVAAGSVPTLLVAGRWIRRVGGRTVCLLSAPALALALPLLSGASGAPSLGLILALLGAASGALDVAMNSTALEFQRRRGATPILSRLHGGYSLGVLVGATGGVVAVAAGLSVTAHFAAVTGVLLILLTAAAPHLPDVAPPPGPHPAAVAPRPRPLQSLSATIAAIAIAGLLLEGTMTDWSALLVGRDLGAGATVGSGTVAAFSLAMFASRTAGDLLVPAMGRARYLVSAGAVAAGGASAGLLIPGWIAGYLGVIAVGLVLGPVFPLAIDLAAERAPHAIASAAADVSAVGYSAYLGGPPLIGLLAQALGLPTTVALAGAACGLVLVAAALRCRPRRSTPRRS